MIRPGPFVLPETPAQPAGSADQPPAWAAGRTASLPFAAGAPGGRPVPTLDTPSDARTRPLPSPQEAPVEPAPARHGLRELGFGLVLLAVGISIGILAGPATRGIAGVAPEKLFWTASRITAMLAYLAFTGSVCYGLAMTSGILDAIVGRPVSYALHQDLALGGLALTAAHVLLLLGDAYIGFDIVTLLVPGLSPYRQVPTLVGQVALYAGIFFAVGFFGRRWMGVRLWRAVHTLSIAVFVLATAHGLLAGTDSKLDVVWWLYVACSLAVLFLFVHRVANRRERRPRAPRYDA
ncbi:MAG: hypothetical protein WCK58_15365 [Chloroflexota bacterium]